LFPYVEVLQLAAAVTGAVQAGCRLLCGRHVDGEADEHEIRKKYTNIAQNSNKIYQIKSFYSLIKYKYVLHMTVGYTSWTNKPIKILQLHKKQNINQE